MSPYGEFLPAPLIWLPDVAPEGVVVQSVPAATLFGSCAFTAFSLSVSPGGELVPFNLAYDGTTVSFATTGGVSGRTYNIKVLGKTPDGEVLPASIGVCCVGIPVIYPLPTPINPSYGEPAVWPCGSNPVLSPVTNLPSYTIAATGTTALTAAVVPILAITLINAGAGGGVLIGVPAATWNGYRPVFQNRSGGVITLYPYAGDQFESLAPSAGTTLVNDQSVTLSVALSGAIVIQ